MFGIKNPNIEAAAKGYCELQEVPAVVVPVQRVIKRAYHIVFFLELEKIPLAGGPKKFPLEAEIPLRAPSMAPVSGHFPPLGGGAGFPFHSLYVSFRFPLYFLYIPFMFPLYSLYFVN